jgi:hypothetical protein
MSKKSRRARARSGAKKRPGTPTPIIFAQVTTCDLHLSSMAKANVPAMVLLSPALSAAATGATVSLPGHPDLYMTGLAAGPCCTIELSSYDHGLLLTIGIAADIVAGAALWRALNDGVFGRLDGAKPPPAIWCGVRWEEGALSATPEHLEHLPTLVMGLGWTWMVLCGITP